MQVAAVKDYVGVPRDVVDNFHGNQLVFIGWDDHLMFCAPLAFPFPPTLRFGDIVEKVLPGAYGYHPDWAKIDWSKVGWMKSGEPWAPHFNRTLAENGIGHKDALRFRTPGLTGIQGSCS